MIIPRQIMENLHTYHRLKRSGALCSPASDTKVLNASPFGNFRIIETVSLNPSAPFSRGKILFQIYFHTRSNFRAAFFRQARKTIPLFVGFSGFQWKLFLEDTENRNSFAGHYCWDSLQDIQNYLESYACRLMKNSSYTGKAIFRAIERNSGKILKEGIL